MAVTAKWYGEGLLYAFQSATAIDWDNAGTTIKLALLTSSYTPNQDTDAWWSDVSANDLASGGGYTTGGQALASKSLTYDAASNEVRMTATSPVSWTFTGTKAFRYGVIYRDTTVAGTSALLGYIDYGAQSITDSTFNSNIDSTHGMLTVTAS